MTAQFGFCAPIFASPGSRFFRTPNYDTLDTTTTMSLCRLADDLGYDSLWVADHLMLGKDQAILEGWTMLAALAGATRQARLGIIHQANLLRHPSLTAKMTTTLDQISQGRFIFFTDPGSARDEHLAYGLPWSDETDERIDRFEEGLEIVTSLWTADTPVTYAGRYYTLAEAVCSPHPLQQPHPPVWIGSVNTRMHEICARYARGWNTTPISVDDLPERLGGLADACTRVGRSYDDIEKSLEVQILVAEDVPAIRGRLQEIIARDPVSTPVQADLQAFISGATDRIPDSIMSTWLIGPPDEIEDRIRVYMREGITHFLFWFADVPREDGIRLFADQVMPKFR